MENKKLIKQQTELINKLSIALNQNQMNIVHKLVELEAKIVINNK